MRFGNLGFINLERTRAQLFARPHWLGFEHPIDHVPSPVMGAKVISLHASVRARGATKRAAGSD